ncbi:hypothetical protein LCGC14_0790000 [marine sediment metagenome]|uniref:Uncharacterized protein n=1 Tax=marine sediment metagenome TaxID=412755 RepID=A0A0F9PT08_9ZZZZ
MRRILHALFGHAEYLSLVPMIKVRGDLLCTCGKVLIRFV